MFETDRQLHHHRARAEPILDPAQHLQAVHFGQLEIEGALSATVAIIDYGSGNLHSAAKAFERAARESGDIAEGPLSMGQDAGLIRDIPSAAERRFARTPGFPTGRSDATTRSSTPTSS